MSRVADTYRFVGRPYDALTWIFSGPAIHRTRTAMLDDVQPGERVLFAGVGQGRDALLARRLGAQVTVVDASATMLQAFSGHLSAAGLADGVAIIHADVRAVAAEGCFDRVVANFFLNVFDVADARRVLAVLLGHLRDGGQLIVGDFRSASGPPPIVALQHLHWWCAVLFFGLVARNALHPLLDLPTMLDEAGVEVVERRTFRVAGLPLYEALRGRRRTTV